LEPGRSTGWKEALKSQPERSKVLTTQTDSRAGGKSWDGEVVAASPSLAISGENKKRGTTTGGGSLQANWGRMRVHGRVHQQKKKKKVQNSNT